MYLMQVCQSEATRIHRQQAYCTIQADFARLQTCRLS